MAAAVDFVGQLTDKCETIKGGHRQPAPCPLHRSPSLGCCVVVEYGENIWPDQVDDPEPPEGQAVAIRPIYHRQYGGTYNLPVAMAAASADGQLEYTSSYSRPGGGPAKVLGAEEVKSYGPAKLDQPGTVRRPIPI